MAKKKVWYFLNQETSMMFMQQFHNEEGQKATMMGCKVQVETLEFDHIRVIFPSGAIKYFQLSWPYSKSLTNIKEAVYADRTGFDDFDLYVQCEEVYHE